MAAPISVSPGAPLEVDQLGTEVRLVLEAGEHEAEEAGRAALARRAGCW